MKRSIFLLGIGAIMLASCSGINFGGYESINSGKEDEVAFPTKEMIDEAKAKLASTKTIRMEETSDTTIIYPAESESSNGTIEARMVYELDRSHPDDIYQYSYSYSCTMGYEREEQSLIRKEEGQYWNYTVYSYGVSNRSEASSDMVGDNSIPMQQALTYYIQDLDDYPVELTECTIAFSCAKNEVGYRISYQGSISMPIGGDMTMKIKYLPGTYAQYDKDLLPIENHGEVESYVYDSAGVNLATQRGYTSVTFQYDIEVTRKTPSDIGYTESNE